MPAAQGTICRIQSASNEAGGSIQGRVPRTEFLIWFSNGSGQIWSFWFVEPWKDGVIRVNVFLKDFDHSQLMVIGVIGITGVNVLEHVVLECHFNLVSVTIHAHYMADITV